MLLPHLRAHGQTLERVLSSDFAPAVNDAAAASSRAALALLTCSQSAPLVTRARSSPKNNSRTPLIPTFTCCLHLSLFAVDSLLRASHQFSRAAVLLLVSRARFSCGVDSMSGMSVFVRVESQTRLSRLFTLLTLPARILRDNRQKLIPHQKRFVFATNKSRNDA